MGCVSSGVIWERVESENGTCGSNAKSEGIACFDTKTCRERSIFGEWPISPSCRTALLPHLRISLPPQKGKNTPQNPQHSFSHPFSHPFFPITTCRGPTSAKKPILLTSVTMASRTSPLKGRKTIAWYCSGNVTKPIPSLIRPWICEWNRVG